MMILKGYFVLTIIIVILNGDMISVNLITIRSICKAIFHFIGNSTCLRT